MVGRLKTGRALRWAIAAGMIAAGILCAPRLAAETPLWPDGSSQDVLGPSLRQWLSTRERPIRIGVTTIPPQVFYNPDNGQLSGLCIDYIRELETILSCRFEVVHFDSWAAMMSAAMTRHIDVIYAAQKTPLREQSFLFTQPYLVFDNKIVTTEETNGSLTLADLAGKRVAVVRGAAVEEYLSANYPAIQLLPVDDELIGLSRVSFHQADAMVIEIARASWYIQQNKFTNLRIAGDAGYPFKLGYAVRNDWPELTEILDVGLARISPQRRLELLNRWIIPSAIESVELRILVGVLAGLGALVFVIVVWNRLLSIRVRQRTAELQKELAAHENDLSQLRRFETVISLSDDMMAFVDAEGIVRAVNDAFLTRVFGKPKEDILHHRIEDLFEPAFYESSVRPYIEKALRGETAVYVGWTTTGLMKDCYIRATFHPYHNGSGQIEGVAVVAHDITDIQNALQKIKDRENRLNSIITAAPVGIGLVRDRVFQSVNKLICIITGYSEQELLGQNARMLYPTQEEYEYVGTEKYRQIEKFGIGTVETRWVRKDGRIIDVLLSSVPLDAADLSKGVTFTALDITDRKAAEAALEDSRNAMERLIGNLPGIAYRCQMTPDWPMEFISRGCREMTGYDEEAFYSGQITWGKLIFEDDNKRILRDIATAVGKKEPYRIEYRIRTRSGQTRWFWEQGCGVFDQAGNVVAMEGFIADITERRQAEQVRENLLKALRSKNEELQSIVFIASHDLRSPLVNIRGFAGELERSIGQVKAALENVQLSPEVRSVLDTAMNVEIPEALAFIKKGNQKMDQLLNGLLRLSRIGTVELNTAALEMDKIIAEILANRQYNLRCDQIDMAVEGSLPACCGDATLIMQVFANLIDNAVKYRCPDRPAVIRIRGRSENGRSIYEIQDNGIGIAPEHKDKIFEIFHQLNPGAGGEGLGLTIVRRILDRQDGHIEIDSCPQQGTTVRVSLPAAPTNK